LIPSERENIRYANGSGNPIELEEKVMFSFLRRVGKGRLLDVGCGVGTISIELQKKGFEVYGVDFSSVAIQKSRALGINAIECDVDESGLPFEDSYFDVVWASDVVEHVFDPLFLLEDITRVLKPTGKALISTPNDMNLYRRISMFLTGRSPQSWIYRNLRQSKHHTIMSMELLEYMLSASGLGNYSLGAIIKIPKIDKEYRFSSNRKLCNLFSRTFIVQAKKSTSQTSEV